MWKTLFPGTGDLSVGVINLALGFSGLNALESGQQGIEGFFGAKGAVSVKKPSGGISSGDGEDSSSSMKPTSKARRTASPTAKKDRTSKAKRDFFGTAATTKRKHEVIDDSDSDIVEISPPPHAKRTNTGSSGYSTGSRIGTPTPSGGGSRERRGSSVSKDASKDKKPNSTKGNAKEKAKGIASFFTPAGSNTSKTNGKSKTRK